MRRVVVAVVGALVVAGSLAVSATTGSGMPALTFAPGTPRDLRSLASDTWERFGEAFPARTDCMDPVELAGAWELRDRATYDPEDGLVTVRIPGTAPNLRASIVHEFAHHLEFTCAAHEDLRRRFLAAQGLPPDTVWFDGPSWERTPSEEFAEATVVLVVGRPGHLRIRVQPAALAAIREWAQGSHASAMTEST
jgi:hypothetical protein